MLSRLHLDRALRDDHRQGGGRTRGLQLWVQPGQGVQYGGPGPAGRFRTSICLHCRSVKPAAVAPAAAASDNDVDGDDDGDDDDNDDDDDG